MTDEKEMTVTMPFDTYKALKEAEKFRESIKDAARVRSEEQQVMLAAALNNQIRNIKVSFVEGGFNNPDDHEIHVIFTLTELKW